MDISGQRVNGLPGGGFLPSDRSGPRRVSKAPGDQPAVRSSRHQWAGAARHFGFWNVCLTKKQVKVLEGIFADPVCANIDWHDVESLLSALGAELSEGRGSRVRVALNGVRATFHEPHPEKEIGKGAVRSLRDFLISAGIRPTEGEAAR